MLYDPGLHQFTTPSTDPHLLQDTIMLLLDKPELNPLCGLPDVAGPDPVGLFEEYLEPGMWKGYEYKDPSVSAGAGDYKHEIHGLEHAS